MDIEENGQLLFLDVLAIKKTDNTLGPSIKYITGSQHTDRYLHIESHHHSAQKQAAIHSLVHKALNISDKEHLQTELSHLKQILQQNGYIKGNINNQQTYRIRAKNRMN